ncbi:MAG: hypothetical protein ACREMQ_05655 [Longimicrobiales bacterium]
MQIRRSRRVGTFATLALLSGLWPGAMSAAAEHPLEIRTIAVCMDPGDDFGVIVLGRAREMASAIFKNAGIRIKWLGWRCSDDVVRITFNARTPYAHMPGTLAYALASTRTIVVHSERVQRTVESWQEPFLLAHVIAHEITHLLQGEIRHSPAGVMKSQWSQRDYREMEWKRLSFTEEDIRLIHTGLDRQEQRPALAATARQ